MVISPWGFFFSTRDTSTSLSYLCTVSVTFSSNFVRSVSAAGTSRISCFIRLISASFVSGISPTAFSIFPAQLAQVKPFREMVISPWGFFFSTRDTSTSLSYLCTVSVTFSSSFSLSASAMGTSRISCFSRLISASFVSGISPTAFSIFPAQLAQVKPFREMVISPWGFFFSTRDTSTSLSYLCTVSVTFSSSFVRFASATGTRRISCFSRLISASFVSGISPTAFSIFPAQLAQVSPFRDMVISFMVHTSDLIIFDYMSSYSCIA